MSELLAHALRYLPRTVPLRPGRKEPILHDWPNWPATRETVEDFWRERPDANVGIRTGRGLVVVDVDPCRGGTESLAAGERDHGALPPTPEVATGGGGRHLFFRGPHALRSAKDPVPGIEIKAAGCMVAAPPSLHPDTGRLYVWQPAHPLIPTEIARLPAWLERLAGRPQPSPAGKFNDLAERDPLHRIPASVYVPKLTGRPINHGGFVRCPFHKNGQERRPALKVYDKGGWKCHACGAAGRIYQLAALLGGFALPLTAADRALIGRELTREFAEELSRA